MRVLYVNHTSRVSGAERSLLELLRLVRTDAAPILACPTGDLMQRAEAIGVRTVELNPPQVSFSSGPCMLGLALLRFARAGLQVRALARRHHVDVVHAASTRAGLLTSFCIFSRPRRVVDVRDVLPRGIKAVGVRWALRLSADLLVFNSMFTRDQFGPTRPADAEVVYPLVDIERFLDLPLPSQKARSAARTLGVVGQITPWKGQDVAIRILASVREEIPDARLRVVGSVVFTGNSVGFDNEGFNHELQALAAKLGVADAVEFADETEDIHSVLASLDVLLVPSWAEPFGRVLAEGMAAGVPVIATTVGGSAEIIRDAVSGFLAPPHDHAAWVGRVTGLLGSVELSTQIAEAGRARIRSLLGDVTSAGCVRTLYNETPSSHQGSSMLIEEERADRLSAHEGSFYCRSHQ